MWFRIVKPIGTENKQHVRRNAESVMSEWTMRHESLKHESWIQRNEMTLNHVLKVRYYGSYAMYGYVMVRGMRTFEFDEQSWLLTQSEFHARWTIETSGLLNILSGIIVSSNGHLRLLSTVIEYNQNRSHSNKTNERAYTHNHELFFVKHGIIIGDIMNLVNSTFEWHVTRVVLHKVVFDNLGSIY